MIDDDVAGLRLCMALLLARLPLKGFRSLPVGKKIDFGKQFAGLNAKELTRAVARQTEIMAVLPRVVVDCDDDGEASAPS